MKEYTTRLKLILVLCWVGIEYRTDKPRREKADASPGSCS